VMVEREALINFDLKYVTMDPIKRIENERVFIQFFNGEGFLEERLDRIAYADITKILFNIRYVDIFSKYLG
jgi:hypothetical protein